jgi:hypothetical protein
MARPTIDEIRDLKNLMTEDFDKAKNKSDRERIGYGILVLQFVLDERP